MHRTYVIGALMRPSFRRFCFNLTLTFEEQKGILDSVFKVSGSDAAMEILHKEIVRLVHEDYLIEKQRNDAIQLRKHNRWWRRLGRWIKG